MQNLQNSVIYLQNSKIQNSEEQEKIDKPLFIPKLPECLRKRAV